MPLHRLEQLQGHLGTPVPASTQWEVVRDRAPALEPVYAELARLAAQGRLLHNDGAPSSCTTAPWTCPRRFATIVVRSRTQPLWATTTSHSETSAGRRPLRPSTAHNSCPGDLSHRPSNCANDRPSTHVAVLRPKYHESAVSMMSLLRYRAGMPLHRLEQLQGHLGTPVPASTQWEVVRDRAPALEPVYAELARLAAQGRLLHNDDTSIRILEFMGKRRADLLEQGQLPDPDRTGLFTTAVVAITDAGPIALFFSGRKHAGENLGELLDQRDPALAPPIQMCDGLDRNRPSEHDVVESNCLAHGRRHVVDEVDNFPDECRHVLEALGQVFKNESTCVAQGLCGQERLAFHQRESGPVMATLQTWIRAELDDKRVEPNSGLGDAYGYLLKRWDKLTLFLRVPDAPLENNICERTLKMAIRQRNNSLFYRSQRGARVGDVYMTLIYTAELHRQNPFHYMTALLDHEAAVAADPAAWLPWNYLHALARASPATISHPEQPRSR